MSNVQLNRTIARSLLIVAVPAVGLRFIFDLYAKIWWFERSASLLLEKVGF